MNVNLNLEQKLNSQVQFNEFSQFNCNVKVDLHQITTLQEFNSLESKAPYKNIQTTFNIFHIEQNITELIKLLISLFELDIENENNYHIYYHLFIRHSDQIISTQLDFMTSEPDGLELLRFNLLELNRYQNKVLLPENTANINRNYLNIVNQDKVVLWERLIQIGIQDYLSVNDIHFYLIEYHSNRKIESDNYNYKLFQSLYPNVNKDIDYRLKLNTQPIKLRQEKEQLDKLNTYQLRKDRFYRDLNTSIIESNLQSDKEFDINVFFHEIHWQLSNGQDDTYYDLNSFFDYLELRDDTPIANIMDATSSKKNVDLLNSQVKIYKEYIKPENYRTLEKWKQSYKRDLLFLHNMNKVFSCRGLINIDPEPDKMFLSPKEILTNKKKLDNNNDYHKTIFEHGIEYLFIVQSDGSIFVRFYIPFITEEETEQITIRRFYLWLEEYTNNLVIPFYNKTMENENADVYAGTNSLFYVIQQLQRWNSNIKLHFDEISYMNLFFDINIVSKKGRKLNTTINDNILKWIKANEYFIRSVKENNSIETGIILHLKYKNISYYENMEMIFDVMSAYVFKHQKANKEREVIKNELFKMLKDNYPNKTEQELLDFVNNWLYKYFDNKSRFTKSFSGVDILLSKISNDYRVYLNGFRNFNDYRHVIYFVQSFFKLYYYRNSIPFVKDTIDQIQMKLGGKRIEDVFKIYKIDNQTPIYYKNNQLVIKSGGGNSNVSNTNNNEIQQLVELDKPKALNNSDQSSLPTRSNISSRSYISSEVNQNNISNKGNDINSNKGNNLNIENKEFDGSVVLDENGELFSVTEGQSFKSATSFSSRSILGSYRHEPHAHQHENLLIGQEQSYRGYRISLLTKLDPEVFKNTGKKAYSRFCQVSNGRVPIVIKNDDNYRLMLEKIVNKKLPNETKEEREKRLKEILRGDERLMTTKKDRIIDGYSLKYRNKHYICPEAWCIHCNLPLLLRNMNVMVYNPGTDEKISYEDYLKLNINKHRKYYDFKIVSGYCPYCNKGIILNEDSKEKINENQKVLVARNALGRQGYPGFISKKSHPNELCMVCCFNNPLNRVDKDGGKQFYQNFITYEGYEGDKKAQDKEHSSYVMPSATQKRIKRKTTTTSNEEIQISLKPCHIHRFGLLPNIVNSYLNQHQLLQEYSHITGLPFQKKSQEYYQFLRKGIAWSNGMFSNLMDLMYYYMFDFDLTESVDENIDKVKQYDKNSKIEKIIQYFTNMHNFENLFNTIDNGFLKYYFKNTNNLFTYLRTNLIWKDEFIFPLLGLSTLLQSNDSESSESDIYTPLFIILEYENLSGGVHLTEDIISGLTEKVNVYVSHREFSNKHHIYFIFKRKIQNDVSAFDEQSWLNGGYNYEPIVFLCKNENENAKTIKQFQYTKFDENILQSPIENNSLDIVELLNSNINHFMDWIQSSKDIQEFNKFKNSFMKPKTLNNLQFSFSALWTDTMYRQCAILSTLLDETLWIPIYPKLYSSVFATSFKQLQQLNFSEKNERNTIFNYFQSPDNTIIILKKWLKSISDINHYNLIPYKKIVKNIFGKNYIVAILTTNILNEYYCVIPVQPLEIDNIEYIVSEIDKFVYIRNQLNKLVDKKEDMVEYITKKLIPKLQFKLKNDTQIQNRVIYEEFISVLQSLDTINEINIQKLIDQYNEYITDFYMSNEYEIGILEHSIIKEANLTPNYLYDYGTILIKNQLSQHSKDLVNGVIDERVTTSITDLNDKYAWKWIKYLFVLYFKDLPNFDELAIRFDKKELDESDKFLFREIYKEFCKKYVKKIQSSDEGTSEAISNSLIQIESEIYDFYTKGNPLQSKHILISYQNKLIIKFYKYFIDNEFFRHPFCSKNWQWDIPVAKIRPNEFKFIFAEWNAKILEELSVFKITTITA